MGRYSRGAYVVYRTAAENAREPLLAVLIKPINLGVRDEDFGRF